MYRQNDLCSYRKDLVQGERNNIIFILKGEGMTEQHAIDRIGEMMHDCYRRWYTAKNGLPFWGEGIDRDVITFVGGCRNIALGNLHWRYGPIEKSQRRNVLIVAVCTPSDICVTRVRK